MDTSNSGDVEAPKDPGALKTHSSVTDTEILGKHKRHNEIKRLHYETF